MKSIDAPVRINMRTTLPAIEMFQPKKYLKTASMSTKTAKLPSQRIISFLGVNA